MSHSAILGAEPEPPPPPDRGAVLAADLERLYAAGGHITRAQVRAALDTYLSS